MRRRRSSGEVEFLEFLDAGKRGGVELCCLLHLSFAGDEAGFARLLLIRSSAINLGRFRGCFF